MNSHQDILISFDGAFVSSRSELEDARRFVLETFEHLRAHDSKEACGSVSVDRVEENFRITSTHGVDLCVAELSALFPQIVDEITACFMSARTRFLWLHAGAVEQGGDTILFLGASGNGKSTFSTRFTELGWRFMSDDVVPVSQETLLASAYPQLAHRRTSPSLLYHGTPLADLNRESVRFSTDKIFFGAARVASLVFLKFDSAASYRLSRLTPGESAMKLLENTRGWSGDAEPALGAVASLSRSVVAFALQYRNASEAIRALVEQLRGGIFLANKLLRRLYRPDVLEPHTR